MTIKDDVDFLHSRKSDWMNISKHPHSEAFIKKHLDKLDQYFIAKYQKLSEPFIEELFNLVGSDKDALLIYHKVSEAFLRKYQHTFTRFQWSIISECQDLSIEFIREFQNVLDWEKLTFYKNLDIPSIKEFKDKIDWFGLSTKQTSQELILEFQDYLILEHALYANFSYELLDKLKEKININYNSLAKNVKLSEDFIRKNIDKFDFSILAQHQSLSDSFIDEFEYLIDKQKP